MRKVISGLFITLDGVTEEPSNWQETFDEDMAADLGSDLAQIDAILLGRITYAYWAAYWPTYTSTGPDGDYANFINNTPKYVVSSTLDKVEWGGFDTVRLVKGDNLVEEINRLKAQPGKNIAVQGSPTLVNSLLQNDLLDELKLIVHNVVVYKGKHLFDGGEHLKRLNLVSSKSTRSGVVILTYQPRQK
ncbi:MAG: dihydrofolate reductase family protein [Thermaceae bacterium]|nr:dihydrofolate reductase family protein [Thermaceae bacterium]